MLGPLGAYWVVQLQASCSGRLLQAHASQTSGAIIGQKQDEVVPGAALGGRGPVVAGIWYFGR